MAAKSGKRPLRSLSAHEKLDAIRRVHDGESKASVARDIGVPESTLRGWCKNEDKISYLSRQSSPETDESLETKLKKPKLDERSFQPFNLSLKPSLNIPPDSKVDRINGNESFKTSQPDESVINDRERNRAELARLSVELGLNRPEMFLPSLNVSASNLADLTANIGLLAQWNALLMQQQQQKVQKTPKKVVDVASASTNHIGLLKTVDQEKNKAIITDKQSLQESVWYWLKSQQSSLGASHLPATMLNSASSSKLNNTASSSASCFPSTTSTVSNVSPDQNIFINNWYKQMAYQQQSLKQDEKPILYQQLTKEVHPKQSITPPKVPPEPVIDQQNTENFSIYDESLKQRSKVQSSKIRSVLDNILFNNNNVSATQKDDRVDESSLSQKEAIEHGEKFLKWMEACSDPSVTAMQIMQFRTLLSNIKSGADKKNGELQNKTKSKRK